MRWMIVVSLVLSVTACGRWKGDGTDQAVPDPIGPAIGMKDSFGVPVALAGEQADENLLNNRKADEPAHHAEGGHAAPAHGADAHAAPAHAVEGTMKPAAHGDEHKQAH